MSEERHKLESPRRTVAVVENDPSMRRSVERLLNAHGFPTKGYTSAEAFLGRDAEIKIGCIVLDVHLDGMSGIELRHRLKDSGTNFPVIFITAIDDDALELEAAEVGCIAYLHKPFPASLLIAAINKAVPDSSTD